MYTIPGDKDNNTKEVIDKKFERVYDSCPCYDIKIIPGDF